MDKHPLLKELQQICCTHNIDEARAQMAFESYIELSEVRKLHDLEYHFNTFLKVFYFLGKTDENDEFNTYVPIMFQDTLTPEDLNNLQQNLCPDTMKLHLLIKDRDSSSTCYIVSNGLVKPDSPFESNEKKKKELNAYQIEKTIYNERKKIYMNALKNSEK